MIEMSMRYQHHVNGRQVSNPDTGPLEALENEDPLRKVWVDQEVFAANLQEKTRVAYKSDAKLPASGLDWFLTGPCAGC